MPRRVLILGGHNGAVLLVYDGQCGFCVRSARWIGARLPDEARVEPWQTLDLDAVGLCEQQARAAVWWIDERGGRARRCWGACAIGRSLAECGGVWGLAGRLLAVPPVAWLARPVYALIAANRHRLSSRSPAAP